MSDPPRPRAGCLDEDTLYELTQGLLEPDARAAVDAHLAGCSRCGALVADLVNAQETLVPSPSARGDPLAEPLRPGSLVDRYIVLAEAGAGAMGQVFVAHDPKLDRKVALKVLSAEAATSHDAEQRKARLWREAQALARLTHENLVGVFDVLSRGDQLVIAMEYVAGADAKQWLRESQRSWREVLAVFMKAGRGLSAAHGAGLVHRDFKPENVLISRTGEVKVSDFGLATLAADPQRSAPTEAPAALSTELTEPGSLLGTPVYMAPELFEGGAATAASDQFAFCVALYEALYGERPFEVQGLRALMAAARARQVRPAPERSRVPARLRTALLRGLSADASARFPSMESLLAELGRDRRRDRLRRAAVAFAVLFIVAAGATLAKRPPEPCGDDSLLLTDAWSDAHRARVRAAFAASGVPGAPALADGVDAALRQYVAAWRTNLDDVCRGRTRGPPDPAALMYLGCLHQLSEDVRAVVSAFERGEPDVVARSRYAAQALEPVTVCDVMRAPTPERAPRPPPRASAAIRLRLAELQALAAGGDVESGLARARELISEVRAAGARDTEVEALSLVVRLERARGRLDEAEQAAREAVRAAHPPRNPAVLGRAWAQLAVVLATKGTVLREAGEAQLAVAAKGTVLRDAGEAAQLEAAAKGTALREADAAQLAVLAAKGTALREADEAAQLAVAAKGTALRDAGEAAQLAVAAAKGTALRDAGEAAQLAVLAALREADEAAQLACATFVGLPRPARVEAALEGALAAVALAGPRPAEALPHAVAAVAAAREAPENSYAVAEALERLGQAQLAANQPASAVLTLAEALAHPGRTLTPLEAGRLRAALAVALWREGSHPRALEVARQARADLEAAGPAAARELATLEAGLRP